MSVLGHHEIVKLLAKKNIKDRLIVTPLMSDDQIGPASIDIRLGNDFIITRRGNLPFIDPAQQEGREKNYQTKHYINFGDKFYLHPQELVLAGTLEYFRLPGNISGSVTSRSSWGRAGLVIATATAVHPGFTGTITLELVNLGEVPLVLYPGLCVAQIVLITAEGALEYDGRFGFYTDAQHAKVNEDKKKDLDFWVTQKNHI